MNKMRIGCKTMRDGVIVSIIFASMAMGMYLTEHYLLFDLEIARGIFRAFSATLLLFVPLILLGTYLRNRPAGDL